MPKIPITLIKGDRHGAETDYRDALPVNMFAVTKDILGANGYMIGWQGLERISSGPGADRGAIYNERFKRQFRISGDRLISKSESGQITDIGNIPGSGQASMPYSFNTQAVITNGEMYLYSPISGFLKVTDPDLGTPLDGVWVNNYYLLTDGESIYHTDISDETSIGQLRFATAEFMPDPSLGVAKTQDNKVIVFGRYTMEYFVDAAQENFAFRRLETRAQKIGIVSTHAKVEAGGLFYIVGGRKDESIGVFRVGLGRVEKISSREIDRILESYDEPELSDIRVETRSDKAITFVIIHLPNETICFNTSVSSDVAWSELRTGLENSPYRAINGVFDANTGRWEYGDKFGGNIGILTEDNVNQYGELSEWELYTPFVKLERGSINEMEIETIPGFNIEADARVAFSTTFDGIVYSREFWCDYGSPMDYGARFFKRRLGYVRDWVGFKFRGASSSRMAFGLMSLDVS